MTIPELLARAGRPELFQPSDALFWDDPYISAQLLKMHLDDGIDAASRPAVVIRATVDRLVRDGVVSPGTRVLDLGCGPGRYAELLASVGCRVNGVDLSARSIAYARERAKERGLDIEYRVQDFHTLADVAAFDVVLQVFGELSTFADGAATGCWPPCAARWYPAVGWCSTSQRPACGDASANATSGRRTSQVSGVRARTSSWPTASSSRTTSGATSTWWPPMTR